VAFVKKSMHQAVDSLSSGPTRGYMISHDPVEGDTSEPFYPLFWLVYVLIRQVAAFCELSRSPKRASLSAVHPGL